jgi:modulator of FtsH protease
MRTFSTTASAGTTTVKVKNKVLSDTMRLLSYTLIFGGLASWFSVASGAGYGSAIVSSVAALVFLSILRIKTNGKKRHPRPSQCL